MKKMFLVFFTLVSIALVVTLAYRWFFGQPCLPPEKPISVKEEAKWFGSCDGGNWIELVNNDGQKAHFRVYRDWDGELLIDASFKPEKCSIILDKNNWKDRVLYYSHSSTDSSVFIVVKDENSSSGVCFFIADYPAYDGSDWNTIKEPPPLARPGHPGCNPCRENTSPPTLCHKRQPPRWPQQCVYRLYL
jgi:hypothetical protein